MRFDIEVRLGVFGLIPGGWRGEMVMVVDKWFVEGAVDEEGGSVC